MAASTTFPAPSQRQTLVATVTDVIIALLRERIGGESKIMLAEIERLSTVVRRGMGALGEVALTSAVTDAFLTLAREKAVDGTISLPEMDRIGAQVRQGTSAALETPAPAPAQPTPRGQRSNPLHRLLVRPLEPLLAGTDPVLPRKYLPNYFDFLKLVFDEDFSMFENRCVAIIRSLMAGRNSPLTWDVFYADDRTSTTLARALAMIVDTVHTAEGLGLWYACMIRPLPNAPSLSFRRIDQVMVALERAHHAFAGECALVG